MKFISELAYNSLIDCDSLLLLLNSLRIEEDISEPQNLAAVAVKILYFIAVTYNSVFPDIEIIGDYTSLIE